MLPPDAPTSDSSAAPLPSVSDSAAPIPAIPATVAPATSCEAVDAPALRPTVLDAPLPPALAPAQSPDPTAASLRQIEALLAKIDQQQAYLPPQIRQLGTKLESVAQAAGQPAFRALLLSLIGFADFLELLSEKNLPAEDAPDASHRRNYEMLHNQLKQVLADAGVSPIAAAGSFDPQLHRVVGTQAGEPDATGGQIVKVLRRGYFSGSRVIRYSDVIVTS